MTPTLIKFFKGYYCIIENNKNQKETWNDIFISILFYFSRPIERKKSEIFESLFILSLYIEVIFELKL